MSYWLLSATTPKARKEHTCIWCGQKILKGEKHKKLASMYEGDFQSHRWHMECNDAFIEEYKITKESEFDPHSNPRPALCK